MGKTNSKSPATLTADDPVIQELQGRKWIALAEGNTKEVTRLSELIAAKTGHTHGRGLIARLMSGGQ
jgi:hypothetical protein